MSDVLAHLLDVHPEGEPDVFTGAQNGPTGKRAYGGLLASQAMASACRTLRPDLAPTSLHVQYLRGGDAGTPTLYEVERVYDGRTSASRRVRGSQDGRLLITVTASFAAPAAGPVHAQRAAGVVDPESLERTGPIGPAPALPPGEIDIRIRDEGSGTEFVRHLWWRVTSTLPDDPRLHACAAVFVTDIYGVDPVLAVHGFSMTNRTHHAGTTDSSMWFHGDIHADRWNLLQSRSPAAGRGRGVMTAALFDADAVQVATLVHEGQAADRQ